jgi:hypothetical protein
MLKYFWYVVDLNVTGVLSVAMLTFLVVVVDTVVTDVLVVFLVVAVVVAAADVRSPSS